MAKNFNYELHGLDDLVLGLKERANMKLVEEAVALNGSEMQQSAVRYAPYDTGFLSRSIELDLMDGNLSARVFPTANYAYYQEYGTRYQSGTPFMRPALYRQQPLFVKDLRRLMK